MRKLLVAVLLFGLGIGGAVIVAKPAAAQTQAVDGTITGSVGSSGTPNAFVISLSQTTVPNGTYEFDVTDYASLHNFDLLSPGGTSLEKTGSTAPTTGAFTWTIALADGVYKYRCDFHQGSMKGVLTVGTPATTTSTTSTTTATTQTTTTQTTTTAPTTTTTPTTTTVPTTTTTPTTTGGGGGGGGGGALTVHIVSAKGTSHSVVVKVSSSKHGKAVAQLTKGSKRLAKSSHAVPGKITLKPSGTLKPGSYTVKVTVTAGAKHGTVKKTVKVS